MTDVQLTDNPTPRYTASLFDSLESWLASPDSTFSDWLSHQPVAASTQRVRNAMWRKFLRYLDSLGVSLGECAPIHVSGFTTWAGLEKEQGWRYVKLIERTYAHLIALGLAIPNPGQLAARNAFEIGHNDHARFLDKEEKERLEKHVLLVLREADAAFASYKEKKKTEKAKAAALFAGTRDAAVTALLFGAGLKVSEVLRLSVNCTYSSGVLVLPRSGFSLERHIPLLDFASFALEVWMRYRSVEPELGSILFTADVSRRRTDQLKQTAAMHPATLFRRVNALLNAAGVSEARASGQTLRNTYAAELIDDGADDETLNQALGYTGDFSALHLRAEYELFKNHRVPN